MSRLPGTALCLLLATAVVWAESPGRIDTQLRKESGDLEGLQGTWDLLRVQDNLETYFNDGLHRVLIKGDRFLVERQGVPAESFRLKFGPAGEPRSIDLQRVIEGKKDAGCIPAIYKLEGNTLTVCWDDDQKQRPRGFPTKAQEPKMVMILKRAR